MTGRFILLFLGIVIAPIINAQSEDEKAKEKFLSHYIGFQVNELVKQALNLSNSATSDHPYYLNYALNFHRSGWGINVGFGYNYRTTHSGDAINKIRTEFEGYSFRAGPEKKFYLGKKLVAGVGIDLLNGSSNNNSTVRIEGDFDQFSQTETVSKVEKTGLGPRFFFSYRVSRWLLIGTEATYYYTKEVHSNKVTEITSFFQQESVRIDEEKFDERDVTFNIPTALFLIINF